MKTLSRHDAAVAEIQAGYRELDPGSPVRLRKPTSNLFRPREHARAGLDVSDLADVISIDVEARTADVQGMCTYERLVEATLAHGLMPLVVPQLKTVTLGGAVTGLGIESSSLRNGLPHESVLELDILTGTGEVITAGPRQNADLFDAFPNSYGSLGYATRLRIELQPVSPFVALRHIRFESVDDWSAAVAHIAETGEWDGRPVEFVDGTMFGPSEVYLTLGDWAETGTPSDYTGQQIYYRSIRERDTDLLTVHDYIWRWDTDWFWCSGAFGAQHPLVRRVWPRSLRRSDVYHRIVGLENRFHVAATIDRWRGRPAAERVVQDVEVPLERTSDFTSWFAAEVGMTPVWLCPMRSRRAWPLYPLEPGRVYVNAGFWGTVAIPSGHSDGDMNIAIERKVAECGGHKSLYSDVYYDRATFDALYGGDAWSLVKKQYDPDSRLSGMFEKVVGTR